METDIVFLKGQLNKSVGALCDLVDLLSDMSDMGVATSPSAIRAIMKLAQAIGDDVQESVEFLDTIKQGMAAKAA